MEGVPAYRQCSVSVLDTRDDPHMRFDSDGRCHYYHEYQRVAREHVRAGERGQLALEELASRIRKEGKGKAYDCVIGLSGGVDSTYVAWLAAQLQLRPLAVHFDNGWNSEFAVRNIESVVGRFGWDLHTLVVDWDEFRDLQRAYLHASVIDIEVVTDHAIAGTLFRLGRKFGVHYLLSGSNVVTEGVMPPHWIFNKLDHRNLLDIHRRYGTVPLRTYPLFDTVAKKRTMQLGGVRWVSPLNLADYRYDEAKQTLARDLGWIDYGGKHHESVFTRFYQCEILPRKFGVDKRKAHLSNLIFSDQVSRAAALEILRHPACSIATLESDKQFVLKKLGLTTDAFELLMAAPPRPHSDFEIERPLVVRYPMLRAFGPAFGLFRSITRFASRERRPSQW